MALSFRGLNIKSNYSYWYGIRVFRDIMSTTLEETFLNSSWTQLLQSLSMFSIKCSFVILIFYSILFHFDIMEIFVNAVSPLRLDWLKFDSVVLFLGSIIVQNGWQQGNGLSWLPIMFLYLYYHLLNIYTYRLYSV